MSDAKVREAAEQVADEALSAQDAGWWGERRAMGYRAAVECYLRGHADASASLRELQMAAAELVNHWTNAGGVCLECLQPAEGHRGNCLAGRLAALLPVPAEGAKGGG
jgi:hypothetical protein